MKIGGRAAIYHIGEGFEFMPLQTEYNKDTIKESILNKLLRYYCLLYTSDAADD